MNEKEILAEQTSTFNRLKSLTQQPGWVEYEKILFEAYCNALEEMKKYESDRSVWLAIGKLKCLDHLTERLNSDLKFGEQAKLKYVKKYLNQGSE
jgi:hypothetical protein